MYVENRTKIANFPTPRVFNAPDEGFPVQFGIGVRGPKCLNNVLLLLLFLIFVTVGMRYNITLPDSPKSFRIGLVVLIQYRL